MAISERNPGLVGRAAGIGEVSAPVVQPPRFANIGLAMWNVADAARYLPHEEEKRAADLRELNYKRNFNALNLGLRGLRQEFGRLEGENADREQEKFLSKAADLHELCLSGVNPEDRELFEVEAMPLMQDTGLNFGEHAFRQRQTALDAADNAAFQLDADKFISNGDANTLADALAANREVGVRHGLPEDALHLNRVNLQNELVLKRVDALKSIKDYSGAIDTLNGDLAGNLPEAAKQVLIKKLNDGAAFEQVRGAVDSGVPAAVLEFVSGDGSFSEVGFDQRRASYISNLADELRKSGNSPEVVEQAKNYANVLFAEKAAAAKANESLLISQWTQKFENLQTASDVSIFDKAIADLPEGGIKSRFQDIRRRQIDKAELPLQTDRQTEMLCAAWYTGGAYIDGKWVPVNRVDDFYLLGANSNAINAAKGIIIKNGEDDKYWNPATAAIASLGYDLGKLPHLKYYLQTQFPRGFAGVQSKAIQQSAAEFFANSGGAVAVSTFWDSAHRPMGDFTGDNPERFRFYKKDVRAAIDFTLARRMEAHGVPAEESTALLREYWNRPGRLEKAIDDMGLIRDDDREFFGLSHSAEAYSYPDAFDPNETLNEVFNSLMNRRNVIKQEDVQ